MQAMMVPSREIRRVPRGWQHPPGDALLTYESEADLRAWYADRGYDFADDYPDGYNAARYMPEPSDDCELMAYETVSEGTPLTGHAFDDTPEGRLALIRDLVDSGQAIAGSTPDAEAWAGILFSDSILLNIGTGAFEGGTA